MKPLLLTKHLTLLLMSAAMSSAAKAQLSFDPQATYAVGRSPQGVAVGDFNDDGVQDLAVANYHDNTVSVLPNNGSGVFSTQLTFAAGRQPYGIAVGDFNGDGAADIAVSNVFDNTVSVYLNSAGGLALPAATYAVGGAPHGLIAADLNGDGKADLAAVNGNDNTVSVLLNNGSGGFNPQSTYAVSGNPSEMAMGDFNGDGFIDMVTAGRGVVSVLQSNGSGGFASQVNYAVGSPGSTEGGITVADFNGDGKADIAVVSSSILILTSTVSVLLNNGAGGFNPPVLYNAGTNSYGVATADFNGDGKPDLAVTNSLDNTVSVLLNDGIGNFNPQITYAVGNSPNGVATGDFNGDGKADIVITNNNTNNISILLNATPFATPVTLTSFTGALQHGLAALSWQSGVESNFKQYEVEANAGNKGYATVGVVAAMGSNHSYTFSTAQAAATADYRLKLVNADGSSRYSDVVTLSQNGSGGISVYPNPATTQLHVQAAASSNYQLVNLAGNTVLKGELQAGDNLLNIASLPAGMYILHADTGAYKVVIRK